MDRVLTKADYDFAQGVWGRLQSLWPHIVKTEMELGGLAPEKVDPLPFSTPHGDYAGGYFPAHYDQELVARPISGLQDLFNRTFRQATTPKGHTISRTDFTGPIMLSPEGYLFNHVNNVITRISHGRFIRIANKAVRISHGSGNAMDLSSAQRGPELMKLATMFYSWRSTQYQLQRASIWNTLHAQSPKQVGEGLRQSMYAFAITPLSAALVAGAAPALWPIIKAAASGEAMPDGLAGQWREWIADELLRNLWSGTVGVRDVANAALNKIEGKPGDYRMSPLERLPIGMIQMARDSEVIAAHAAGFQEESQASKNAARNMVDTISEYQGIPIASQAARGAAYAHGVAAGEQTPNDPLDYASGLLHGAPAKH